MDGLRYRKSRNSDPLLDEDTDHYGYNDSNAEYDFDKMMNFAPSLGITFRKHKKEAARIVRKRKYIKKKCKCKN